MTIIRIGEWTFRWAGGRLADVYHGSSPEPVECIQAGPYDWAKGVSFATRETLQEAAEEWVREDGETYLREVVAYR